MLSNWELMPLWFINIFQHAIKREREMGVEASERKREGMCKMVRQRESVRSKEMWKQRACSISPISSFALRQEHISLLSFYTFFVPSTLNILLLVSKTLNGAYAYIAVGKWTAENIMPYPYPYIRGNIAFVESEKVRPNEQLKITLSQTFLFALFSYVHCEMGLLDKYFCSSFNSGIFLSFFLSLSLSITHSLIHFISRFIQ